jgi:hypothetical protein
MAITVGIKDRLVSGRRPVRAAIIVKNVDMNPGLMKYKKTTVYSHRGFSILK